MLNRRSVNCFLCVLFVIVTSGTALETISIANVSSSKCESNETECFFGCCPFQEGVCCVDGFECCRHGQTCIPFIGVCIGLETKNGEPTLVSGRSVPMVKHIAPCPPGTTKCGEGCCGYPNATCCSDKLHCCPEGYRCDVRRKLCLKDSTNNLIGISTGSAVSALKKVFKKPPYKPCPGGGAKCPSYTSCCINDNGDWSCCPNPSLPQLRYGGTFSCCDTWFGFTCCPFICTYAGCFENENENGE